MRRRVVLGFLVPGLVVLHFLLHVGFGIERLGPDLLTLGLLLSARELGLGWSGVLGFFLGLLEDAFSVLSFGASTLALSVVGILGAGTRDFFVGDSFLFFFVYLGAGKLLREVLHWVAVGEGVRGPFLNVVLIDGGIGALYLAVVGVVLAMLFGGVRTSR